MESTVPPLNFVPKRQVKSLFHHSENEKKMNEICSLLLMVPNIPNIVIFELQVDFIPHITVAILDILLKLISYILLSIVEIGAKKGQNWLKFSDLPYIILFILIFVSLVGFLLHGSVNNNYKILI